MKKVLIWNISFPLKNVGGPAGYLYNIHEYLKALPCENIAFLSDFLSGTDHAVAGEAVSHNLRSKIKKIFKGPYILELYTLYCFYFKKYKLPINLDLSEFDFIHFHVIFDLHKYSEYISDYQGKIIITSHMPEPPFDEIINNCPHIKPFVKLFRHFFIKREISFINRNNAIYLFPTKYSLEPYVDASIDYKLFFESRKDFIYYIPTAILDKNTLSRENDYFAAYGIPHDALKVVYIGRHNSVKGYDELKEIGKKIFVITDKIYFIIGGSEEPLKGVDHKQWIELGWINNSNEVISNADIFILPNKHTYFDLVLLEVLRSATALLVSNTGGNKFFINDFSENELKGIYHYSSGDVDEAIECLLNAKDLNCTELGLSNRKLWINHFRMELFIDRYIKLLES